MTQLIGDVENRVKRLPKPSSTADGLQPVFEAVSNAMHAIFDLMGADSDSRGEVIVEFSNTKTPSEYTVVVADNGIGLDKDRFKAFCTTDTPFKIERGGKGVGRLLWLDAFEVIHVESIFEKNGEFKRRKFDFGFESEEPIYNEKLESVTGTAIPGTTVTMKGIRGNSYAKALPIQFAVIKKHFASHFLADFLLGKSPRLVVACDGKSAEYPSDVKQMLVEDRESVTLKSEKFGELKIDGYVLKKEASADLDGSHQIHLVSSGRTVQTRKIDGLIGVKSIGDSGCVFHACITGGFLDERVNQERTQFNFGEKVAEELTKECVQKAKETVLKDEVEDYESYRLEQLEDFVEHYPSFGFEAPQSLLKKTTANADNHEAFAKSLIIHKIRADEDRREMVQSVLNRLTQDEDIKPDLSEEIQKAALEATADENRQLMEYVLRRKFIIEILDALLGKVRKLKGNYDTHIEDTFHQLICPMRVVGDNPFKAVPSSHDLWLLDERLAPATYFASDATIDEFIEGDDKDRVDLMVWDKVHGLGLGPEDKIERVLLVEFKKPERQGYKGDYVLGRQMNRYMNKLRDRKVRSYTGDIVELSADVVFHCYVVADIVGDLELDTQNWNISPSGRGRFDYLKGEYRGTIEIIEWKDLVRDAKARNKNFVEAASLSFNKKGEPIFPVREQSKAQAAE